MEIQVKTQGGRYLARGITNDPEDSRTTARLHAALRILAAANVEPTREHSNRTIVEYGREKHMCDHRSICATTTAAPHGPSGLRVKCLTPLTSLPTV